MKLRGVTLIEILLSVALITALAGFSLPLMSSFQSRNDLDLTSSTIVSAIRRAQVLSLSSVSDSSWGVSMSSTSTTLFAGNSYATRDITLDESYNNSGTITTSGLSEIVFTKKTGLPSTTGTTTVTSSYNGVSNIYINENGVIKY